MVAGAGTLLLTHPVSTGSIKSVFTLQFILPHFIDESHIADLQFLCRLCTCKKYLLTHDGALIMKYLYLLFEYCLSVL
jgi:hypothetical protein